MASHPHESGLAPSGHKPVPTQKASPSLTQRTSTEKRSRRIAPPVPPPKKPPSVEVGGSTSSKVTKSPDANVPSAGPVAELGKLAPGLTVATKSPRPSPKKRRAPQPPSQVPTAQSLSSAPVPPTSPAPAPPLSPAPPPPLSPAPAPPAAATSRSPKEQRSPKAPLKPRSMKVLPGGISLPFQSRHSVTAPSTPYPSDSTAPPPGLLGRKRSSLPSIHAQDSIGDFQPIIDEPDENVYSEPRKLDDLPPSVTSPLSAPTSPPPSVPLTSPPAATGSALYEEVVPRVKRSSESIHQATHSTQSYELAMDAGQYDEPKTSAGEVLEYAEADTGPRPLPRSTVSPCLIGNRISSRSPDANRRFGGAKTPPPVLPYSQHLADKGYTSPRESVYEVTADGGQGEPSPRATEYTPQQRREPSQAGYHPGGSDVAPAGGSDTGEEGAYSYNCLVDQNSAPPKRRPDGNQYDRFWSHERRVSSKTETDLLHYDHIQFSRSTDSEDIEAHPVISTAASCDVSGVQEQVPTVPSLEDIEPAMETVGSSTAMEPRDVYAHVQLREKPPSTSDHPVGQRKTLVTQDSDTSIGPPLDPYQGTPMVGESVLEEDSEIMINGSHDMYSSVDEMPAGSHATIPLRQHAVDSIQMNRRSRSLDDVADIRDPPDSQQDGVAKLQEQRQRRVQQHSYEYVEVKLKPKSKSEKDKQRVNSVSDAPSTDPEEERKAAEKWKNEAEKLRKQHLERHNYDYVEPIRPRLKSFEAPASVSLELVKRPDQPTMPLLAASLQSGEELSWDDSDLSGLMSPVSSTNSARATPPKPVRMGSSQKLVKSPQKKLPPTPVDSAPSQSNGLPPGWEEFTNSLGTYYWHADSGVTQWDRPTAAPTNDTPESDQMYAAPSSLPYTPSLVDETLKELTQASTQPTVDRARKQQRWANSGSSSVSRSSLSSSVTSPDRGVHTYYATSIGYVELAEHELTQRTVHGGCVMNCIARLEEIARDGADVPADIRLEDSEVYLKIVSNTIQVVEVHTHTVLLMQSLQGIRLWGVSKTDPYVFAFVARDQTTQRHRCRIYRCKISGKKIARVLRTACDQILQERKMKQDGVEKPRTEDTVDDAMYNTPRSGNAPPLVQSRSSSSSSATIGSDSSAGGSSMQIDRSATPDGAVQAPEENIDPLLREHKECFAATYLGFTDVPSSSGVETIRNAVSKMQHTSQDNWVEVIVEISSVKIALIDQKTQVTFKEHRIRFLTFLGMGSDTSYCGYIMSSGKDKFWCHVFLCEKTSGKLVMALQSACKARFQRVVDTQDTEEKADHLVKKYLKPAATPAAPTSSDDAPRPTPAPRAPKPTVSKPAPESAFLSVLQKLNRVAGRPATSGNNTYYLSVAAKYYGSEDVYTASAGVKYVQEPFKRLTSAGRVPVSCKCEVDSNGVHLSDAKSKFDLWCPIDKITFVTVIRY
eukprot:scpid13613/ scgid27519/ Amyloid beta A4 precursor protein-binding family B member 1; Protein Fe65